MNFTLNSIIYCIFAANGFLPVAHSVKGTIYDTGIAVAISHLKYKDKTWIDSTMELLSESIGLHLSTIPTFPIDPTKVAVGVVSRTDMGLKTIIALLCRQAKGQSVAIWVAREQAPEEIEAWLAKCGLKEDLMQSIFKSLTQNYKESPIQKKFDTVLELLKKNGAYVYKERYDTGADNTIFNELDIAFAYDGYRDEAVGDAIIDPVAYGALNALKFLKQEKKSVLWALRATSFQSMYLRSADAKEGRVTLADHCTAFNYYNPTVRAIEEKQHLVIPELVYEAIKNFGKECTWKHDVFIISYNGSEVITEEHLHDNDKFTQILESFQVLSSPPLM